MTKKYQTILLAIALPLIFIGFMQLVCMFPITERAIVGMVGVFIALILSYVFLRLEKKSFKDIGLVLELKTPKRFFLGFIIGLAIAITIIFMILIFSDLEIKWNEDSDILITSLWLFVFIPLAFMEEIVFRGYAFIKLNKVIGLRLTQLIMVVLFAYYHDTSGATFTSQLLGPGVWAITFGLAAVWSGGLALPTGLHAAANMVLAVLGMKEDRYAIWFLDYQKEVTESMESQTNVIGIIVQILLLIFGLLMTERFLRKKQDSTQPFSFYSKDFL